MITRTIYIRNFRTIGLKKRAELLLETRKIIDRNYNLGSLYLLIGVGSSGKSNILDSLDRIVNNSILESDSPNSTNAIPEIAIELTDGSDRYEVVKSFTSMSGNRVSIKTRVYQNYQLLNNIDGLKKLQKFQETTKINLIPTVKKILLLKISDSESQSDINNLNPFFTTLFKSFDIDFHNQDTFEAVKRINTCLQASSKHFNNLLTLNISKYKKSLGYYTFKVLIEQNRLILVCLVDKKIINISDTNLIFKFLFNLYYFNFKDKLLDNASILLIDDLDLNAPVREIIELRDYLKDYATHYSYTLLVTTFSPFMISIDDLDELRIIEKVNNETVIQNKFHSINNHPTDTINAVSEALTVGSYVLYDSSYVRTVFVEGITDYAYLTAFKKITNCDKYHLTFIPVNGLIKDHLVKELLSLKRRPIVLVDGDSVGINFKNHYHNQLEIITLQEVSNNFTTIEDLFSANDRPNKKSFEEAVSLKNNIIDLELSNETKDNFNKLFEYIMNHI